MAELVIPGKTFSMVQNRVYCLPQERCLVYALAAIESAFLEAGSFTALTGANVAPGVETAAPFVRSTTAGNLLIVKTD